jgi:hypothetical protein
MKRYWLLFSQVVTVLLAMWFVLATLKPEWLNRSVNVSGVTLFEAPSVAAGTVMHFHQTSGHQKPASKRPLVSLLLR